MPTLPIPTGRIHPLIRVQGVTKSYPEGDRQRVVLRNLSVSFGRGEFAALVGRSGSGKSTLLNLVSGIDLPSSGSILVDDADLARLSEKERTLFRRAHIGFVFQFFNLIPTLTVLENLLLPLELKGRLGDPERRRASDLLESVGLSDRPGTYPDRLSGGEQQRLAVARALVHCPQILLADEPTGNLDAETGGQVLDLLTGLVRREGMTLLLVTHSLEVAAQADRVFTLRGGDIVEGRG